VLNTDEPRPENIKLIEKIKPVMVKIKTKRRSSSNAMTESPMPLQFYPSTVSSQKTNLKNSCLMNFHTVEGDHQHDV
jgi:hypothetical protein